MSTSKLLNEKEAAEYLRVSARTLQGWRHKRIGPAYAKLGDGPFAHVVYAIGDLDDFVRTRRRRARGDD
jgi:hypothetical protein